MTFCQSCGESIVAGVRFCPKCGQATGAGAAASAAGGESSDGAAASAPKAASDDNVMGALAYLLIPAVIFLVAEPYKSRPFVRFHSFQSLFYAAACFGVNIVLTILTTALSIVGVGFVFALLMPFVGLAFLGIWIFLIVKAFQGQEFRLPLVGDWAAKQV